MSLAPGRNPSTRLGRLGQYSGGKFHYDAETQTILRRDRYTTVSSSLAHRSRMRVISSRHWPGVSTRIGPDLSCESLTSTDEPSKAASTQLDESLARLLRHVGPGRSVG